MKKAFLLFLCFYGLLFAANAQDDRDIDLQGLLVGCSRKVIDSSHTQIAIWFPTLFFQAWEEQVQEIPEGYEQLAEEMDPYMIFCVVDFSLVNGKATYASKAEIRNSIRYTDSSGASFAPLNENRVPAYVWKHLQGFAPSAAKELGPNARRMTFFLFQRGAGSHVPSIDITRKNWFTLSWGNGRMLWTLPLDP